MSVQRSLTQIANAAASQLGVLDSGETLSSQQYTDALEMANALLDNWSQEDLLIMNSVTQQFSYVAGQGLYFIGLGQQFNTQGRPAKIVSAHNIPTAGPTNEIKVLNNRQWAQIDDRASSSYKVKY